MKSKLSQFALTGIALATLTGCLPEGDESSSDDSPAPPEYVQIFGPGASDEFKMQVLGSDGLDHDFSVDNTAKGANITVSPSGEAVNVAVAGYDANTAAAAPTVRSITTTGQTYDLGNNNTWYDGALMFDIDVLDREKRSTVTVELASDDEEACGTSGCSIDITGLVDAYVAAGQQTATIPLECFREQGMDLRDTTMPFSLSVNADTEYLLSNIRIDSHNEFRTVKEKEEDEEGNEIEVEVDVLDYRGELVACAIEKSEVLLPDDSADPLGTSVLYQQEGGVKVAGWAIEHSATHNCPNLGYQDEEEEIPEKLITPVRGATACFSNYLKEGTYIGVEVVDAPAADPNQNQSVNFGVKADGDSKDLSQYMENGELQFNLRVESYGDHPTRQFEIRMESPNYGYSAALPFTPSAAAESLDGELITLKVRDFFTDDEGAIDRVNTFRQTSFGFVINTGTIQHPDTIDGMKFYVGDIKLVMNPEPGEQTEI